MPELPEVETMIRGIRGALMDSTVVAIRACRTRCRPISIQPTLANINRQVRGRTIQAVERYGKRIVLIHDNQARLVVEPRMTGLMVVATPPDQAHLRLEWQLTNPEGQPQSVWFWDQRGLGTVTLYSAESFEERFANGRLGPDALAMTPSRWELACARTRRPIKILLLDQQVVAGIGNLYASEILHRARIHPQAVAAQLRPAELQRLHEATEAILLKAIEYEGSTLSDGTYRNALNHDGSYQNEHTVYDRAGQPCPICGTEIIRIVQAQRSTFYCERCQPLPGRQHPRKR